MPLCSAQIEVKITHSNTRKNTNFICHELLHQTGIFLRTVTRIVRCETLGRVWPEESQNCMHTVHVSMLRPWEGSQDGDDGNPVRKCLQTRLPTDPPRLSGLFYTPRWQLRVSGVFHSLEQEQTSCPQSFCSFPCCWRRLTHRGEKPAQQKRGTTFKESCINRA